MKPIFFTVGGVQLHLYGLFVMLGILVSAIVIKKLLERQRLKIKHYFDAILLISLVGLISARLVYILFYWDNLSKIWDIFYFWQEGLSIYGGILGGSIFGYFYLKKYHENMWRWLDIVMIGFFLGCAIIALGGYLSGNFAEGGSDILETTIPLIETIWALFFFIIIIILWKNLLYLEGRIYFIGLGFFAFSRLVFSFMQKREMVLGIFSLEQILSFIILIACAGLVAKWHRFIKPNLKARIIAKLLKI